MVESSPKGQAYIVEMGYNSISTLEEQFVDHLNISETKMNGYGRDSHCGESTKITGVKNDKGKWVVIIEKKSN